ncbi:MAG: sulfite exporter TauE/SafE family protein [Acutalibacteraceae bacterium]
MIKTILFLIVVFFSNIIQCVTGFAGTVLAMPPSIMLVSYAVAKPILNVLGMAVSIGVIVTTYKSINKKEFLKITCVMLLGIIGGIFISEYFEQYAKVLYIVLGITVILIAVINAANFFVKKESKTLPEAVSLLLLILSGLIHGVFVCGGPLLVTYASAKLTDKDEFRSTLSSVWIVLNSVIMFSDIRAGSFQKDTLILLFVSIAVLFSAIVLGNVICKKLNRNTFLVFTYVLMLISGISLILK